MLTIAAKDLRQRVRDRSAYLMGIVGPLGLVLILNASLGSVEETTGFTFGVANADSGELGAAFVGVLHQIEADGLAEVQAAADRAAAEALVDEGEVGAAFYIPDGFTSAAQAGAGPELIVIGDPGSSFTVDVAEAIASSFAREIDYVSTAVAGAIAADVPVDTVVALATTAPTVDAPVQLVAVEGEGRGYDAASYFAVSLSVFFLFFTVQFGVLSLLDERENGTLARLLVTPIAPTSVLLAKLLSSLVIGVITMTVLVVATTVMVGAQWGQLAGVVLLILVGVITAMAVATVVGAVARTAEQAGAYASIVAVVLGLLGGAFFPLDDAPGFLSTISYLSPHRWLLAGFRNLSYGATAIEVIPDIAPLALFIVGLGLDRVAQRPPGVGPGMIVLTIAANSLRRLFRERLNLFFVFALPLLLIVVLGLATRSFVPTIGVVLDGDPGPRAAQLIDRLEATDGIVVERHDDRASAESELEREDLHALLVLPADYDEALDAGQVVDVEYRALPVGSGFEIQGIVEAVLAAENLPLRSSRLLEAEAGMAASDAEAVVAGLPAENEVRVTTIGVGDEPFLDADPVGFVAAQELVLFTFLISATAASALVQVRQLGVARRMLSTPVSTAEVMTGLALGRYAVAIVQSGFILVATALLFGLDWGSWPASLAIVAAFSIVGTAAALLVGALASNENQASAIGVPGGLALAAPRWLHGAAGDLPRRAPHRGPPHPARLGRRRVHRGDPAGWRHQRHLPGAGRAGGLRHGPSRRGHGGPPPLHHSLRGEGGSSCRGGRGR